jgi:hypothetical protein
MFVGKDYRSRRLRPIKLISGVPCELDREVFLALAVHPDSTSSQSPPECCFNGKSFQSYTIASVVKSEGEPWGT